LCLAYVTHPFFFPTLHLLSALYYLSWSNRGILCRNNLKSFKVKIDYALAIKPLLSLLRFGFMEGVNFLGFSVAVEESIIYCFRGGGEGSYRRIIYQNKKLLFSTKTYSVIVLSGLDFDGISIDIALLIVSMLINKKIRQVSSAVCFHLHLVLRVRPRSICQQCLRKKTER
jgi:hypothetical protein